MDYYKYSIKSSPEIAEIIMAFLGELPFDMFEEQPDGIDGYLPESLDSDEVMQTLDGLKENFSFRWSKEHIKGQNWNKEWEANFTPVLVDDFCAIRADFHPEFPEMEHQITINPKMAFGTGHHATTHMVIQLMRDVPFEEKYVLDYGCGTGVLAILAAKMKAKNIDAVDIEEPAFLNTLENVVKNGARGIEGYHGVLKDVPTRENHIILANINRNVILDSLKALHERMVPGGILITSGFLKEDEEKVRAAHKEAGLLPLQSIYKGKWVAMKAFRRY